MSTTEDNGIQSAIEAGAAACAITPRVWMVGDVPVVLTNSAQALRVPTEAIALLDKRAVAPRRRSGLSEHAELTSFIAWVNRFKSEHSALFADSVALRLTAVMNYHPAGGDPEIAAWGDHCAGYECPLEERWKLWAGNSGILSPQERFAQFIEDHFEDLTSGEGYPNPPEVLEMARTLQVHTDGRFTRQLDARTGDFQIVCKQETKSATIEIPRAFLLAIPVFEAGEVWRVEARMRCRVEGGTPMLGYELHRASEIVREAFGAVRHEAEKQTGLTLFAGSPEK